MELSPSWEAANCAATQRTSQHFMEPEGSLPWLQEHSTGPYPEPDQSNPYHTIPSYLCKIHFIIVHPPPYESQLLKTILNQLNSVHILAPLFPLWPILISSCIPRFCMNFFFLQVNQTLILITHKVPHCTFILQLLHLPWV
jgi:hypothetical protein